MAFLMFLEVPPEGGRRAASGRRIGTKFLTQGFDTPGMPHKKVQPKWAKIKLREPKITSKDLKLCFRASSLTPKLKLSL